MEKYLLSPFCIEAESILCMRTKSLWRDSLSVSRWKQEKNNDLLAGEMSTFVAKSKTMKKNSRFVELRKKSFSLSIRNMKHVISVSFDSQFAFFLFLLSLFPRLRLNVRHLFITHNEKQICAIFDIDRHLRMCPKCLIMGFATWAKVTEFFRSIRIDSSKFCGESKFWHFCSPSSSFFGTTAMMINIKTKQKTKKSGEKSHFELASRLWWRAEEFCSSQKKTKKYSLFLLSFCCCWLMNNENLPRRIQFNISCLSSSSRFT